MKKKVTIQDIANELGLSRNTISKAINNTGNVSPQTKEMIFKKAAELGYKQFALLSPPAEEPRELTPVNREIALLTCSVPGSQHLSSHLLDSFQKKISLFGYRLTVYLLRKDTIRACSFPENFNEQYTDGILVMELFDKAYTDFLCRQPIPTLFVDSFANVHHVPIASDILYMENYNTTYQLITHLFEAGCKSIGFVGDRFHCQSFYERWYGYKEAVENRKIYNYEDFCILDKDSEPYGSPDWLANRIKNLPKLPDAFFCANDFLAICTIKALKFLNYNLPNDIKIAGFDNSHESQIIEPFLTTVDIPGTDMGYTATNLLLDRIQYPDTPFRTTYTQTTIIYRNSTDDTK